MKYDHVEMSYGIVIYMDDENMELEEERERSLGMSPQHCQQKRR